MRSWHGLCNPADRDKVSALQLGVRRTYLHRRMVVLKINKKDYFEVR
jgi:hypothetical protein